jgi:integrase
MATHTLTARYLDTLKAHATRYEVFDTEVPALAIRITPSGHKSWTLFYRHHGRLRRLALGRYPDVGLADARKAATQERGRILDGADPAEERKADRATYGDTVGALFDLYKSQREQSKSWSEVRRILEHDVLPAWRHRRVQDLTRRDVRDLVERKAKTAPIMANRLLARVSALLTFALEHDWIGANPAFRIRKPTEEKSRDRVLTRDELRALWTALHETEAKNEHGQSLPRLSATLNDAFLVMLLTAQRCGEVCRMRWEDVSLDTGWWTIPSEDSKNSDPHRVPLTDPVAVILRRRHQRPDDRYVFSGNGGASVAARAKKAAAHLSRGLAFSFRAHDLRRTAASYMAEAGVDRMHIAQVLNNRSVTHSTVTAIYDRYNYDKEKRVALEIWRRELERTVKSETSALSIVPKPAANGRHRRERVHGSPSPAAI